MKQLKELTLSLHDLAMNFHYFMIEEKAKYFTVNGYKSNFWYITDVKQDGTYPCHPIDEEGNVYRPIFFDYKQRVTIHFKI